jgi:hypothetical protein
MLGVVLNRADEQLEPNAYYYQQRYYQPKALPPDEKLRLVSDPEEEVAIAS